MHNPKSLYRQSFIYLCKNLLQDVALEMLPTSPLPYPCLLEFKPFCNTLPLNMAWTYLPISSEYDIADMRFSLLCSSDFWVGWTAHSEGNHLQPGGGPRHCANKQIFWGPARIVKGSLEVHPILVELWDNCSPSSHLDCRHLRSHEAEIPSKSVSGFLTDRNHEIINVCYFQPLHLE